MKRFLSSVWLLALVIAVPVILFFPEIFDKYKVKLESTEPFGSTRKLTFFKDLDSDGKLEKIISFNQKTTERYCLQYFKSDSHVPVDQLNFPNKYHEDLNNIFFFDSDSDGFIEIYGFTLKNDSIFLNWVEPYPDFNSKFDSKFIVEVGSFENGQFDISVSEMHFLDWDNDGTKEFIFPIVGGYSKTPRNIFFFNKQKDTLFKTIYTGVNLYNLRFEDINADGKLELLCDNATSGNLLEVPPKAYSDYVSWLMVFKNDLSYLFQPVAFSKGLQKRVQCFLINYSKTPLITFSITPGDSLKASVFRIDSKGVKKDSLILPSQIQAYRAYTFRASESEFYLIEGNNLTRISSELKILEDRELPIDNLDFPAGIFNLLGDKNQLVFHSFNHDKLIILFDNFGHKIELSFSEEIGSFDKLNILGDGRFFIQAGNATNIYKLQKNVWYYLQYPFYGLVYLVAVLFTWTIQAVRVKQITQKYELQNQVRELELRSFHSQMDPHFMFNAFTTMASLLKKGSQEEAYNAFTKFSKLVRINFEYSQKVIRPLKDELQVVADFLEINKMRFQDKLNFSIHLEDESLIYTKVPKMALQIHVENALKHGLSKKNGHGFVSVYVKKDADYLYLMVEDDGIGRERAGLLKRPSTRQGHKMLQSVFERLNSMNKLKIKQQITDLKNDDGDAAGTRIEIWIPLNLKD
jgi:hypothetical protein